MFLLHCISLITVTSSAHLLSNLRHFFQIALKIRCLVFRCSSAAWALLLHQGAILFSWRLTPAVKSIPFTDELYSYVSNHPIEAFQMLNVGILSPSLRLPVCFPAPSHFLCLGFFFVSVFPPPSRSVGAVEAALIAELHRAQMLKLSESFLRRGDEIQSNWGEAALMKALDGGANHV